MQQIVVTEIKIHELNGLDVYRNITGMRIIN